MTKTYKLYQMRHDESTHGLKFFSFDNYKEEKPEHNTVDFNLYEMVYEGILMPDKQELADSALLEDLFRIFNVAHPTSFTGHSMSVSDVVILDEERAYYCDPYGWTEIPCPGRHILMRKPASEKHLEVVLAKWVRATRNEYVTWIYNKSCPGYGLGHYFDEDDYESAYADYLRRD